VQAVRRGETEQSLRLYETAMAALRTDKLRPLVYFNIGLAHRRLGRFDEALRAFRAALKIDPQYQKAVQQIQEIEKQAGKKVG
jgi:tetratricopeptide (TPR) repeat protein